MAKKIEDARLNEIGELSNIGENGYVSADDVMFLRRSVYQDGVASKQEVDQLFALAARAPEGDPEWAGFFAETVADFYLREEDPIGHLTEAEFASLKEQMSAVAGGATPLALKVLVHLLKNAASTPPQMADYVEERFRAYFEAKNKPSVKAEDVDALRDYLYALGSAGASGVTREEAELLFDIHDLTASAQNDPAWLDFFTKAVAAHLMQHVGYKPLPREDALRLSAWAEDTTIDPKGFIGRLFSSSPSEIKNAYARKPAQSERNEDDAIAAAIAEQVTAREADWLADRIGRDGKFCDLERALLAYMQELEADLPPKLRALVASAA